ncbi:CvpA family protein [Lapidilactobacillus bayanensis]|uniref:CvpA family protein n=1 Tax=Lapidilactobacillus bayanensis TaxID=2485998 RepID=UPI000F777B2C|nr:CvpA family protein [Lapidilactobacillus bayanensis]
MILSIVIALLLLWAFIRGYRRGLVKEILFTVGTFFVFLLGLYYDSNLGDWLLTISKQGDPTDPFAHFVAQTIAFAIIVLAGRIVISWIARLSQAITWLPVIKQANGLGGALIAIVVAYLVIFLTIAILNVIQPSWFVEQYNNSVVAQFMIERTPIVGQKVIDWLFNTQTQTFAFSTLSLY